MYILELEPAFKDYLWGGSKLVTDFHFRTSLNPVAEAWMLSVHPDGESIVKNGEHKGKTLSETLKIWGDSALGTKAEKFDRFPMLIKLIDAKDNLSVQVHPNDQYALQNEHEYGKTEMWYVVDCEEKASLYYGFNREISKEEFRERIENNTLLEVLNEVHVKKGDCFFIEAGTLHAIGKGILIAEIQQNSNSTYRVYDFGRVGADGKPRELHISKALDVTERTVPHIKNFEKESSPFGKLLAKCDYFSCSIFNEDKTLKSDSESFMCLLALEGSGSLKSAEGEIEITKGSCFFIPANSGDIVFTGNAQIIVASL